VKTCDERRKSRPNRSFDLGNDPVGVFNEIKPCESQNLPPRQRDRVLPLAVLVKVFAIAVEGEAVYF
jgi:hypothetical protein